jgi:hypothetical protein
MNFSLTREQVEAARAKLADGGIVMKGDEGQIAYHHLFVRVALDFTYNGTDTLVLSIAHSDIPSDLVWSKVQEWFKNI